MDGLLGLLLFAAFVFLMMRFGCGSHVGHGGHHGHGSSDDHDDAKEQQERNFVDPVCAMQVAEHRGYVMSHKGMAYHFCSRGCLDKFEAAPGLYLSNQAPPPSAAHQGGH
jgi:YHS domain-containing protein